MGWNDRVENNPYEPYPDYTEQDHYEAWMHYQEVCRQAGGISSQNIDPAAVPHPAKNLVLSRFIFRLLGFSGDQETQKENQNTHQQEKEIPF